MATIDKYIELRANGKYRVRLPKWMVGEDSRHVGTVDTLDEAKELRAKACSQYGFDLDRPLIEGLTNEYEEYDPAELWQLAFHAQEKALQREALRADQRITIPDPSLPFALAYLSDMHIGDPRCDYQQVKADVETVRDTPRMWAEFHGDGWNNWIVGRLAHLQRGEPIPFDAETQLFVNVVETVGDKWLWVIPGNHANWTKLLAGVDRVRDIFAGKKVLYDSYEIVFSLHYGPHKATFKIRHKWRYGSVYNPTHGIEVGWQRGETDFDIGLGGHTHIGTFCRPFLRHGRRRFAVLTGCYVISSDYARECGYAPTCGKGCGAHIFYPDGKPPLFLEDLQQASDFLQWLLSRQRG